MLCVVLQQAKKSDSDTSEKTKSRGFVGFMRRFPFFRSQLKPKDTIQDTVIASADVNTNEDMPCVKVPVQSDAIKDVHNVKVTKQSDTSKDNQCVQAPRQNKAVKVKVKKTTEIIQARDLKGAIIDTMMATLQTRQAFADGRRVVSDTKITSSTAKAPAYIREAILDTMRATNATQLTKYAHGIKVEYRKAFETTAGNIEVANECCG